MIAKIIKYINPNDEKSGLLSVNKAISDAPTPIDVTIVKLLTDFDVTYCCKSRKRDAAELT